MYIYKIINKVNGRWYIGKHNGKDPNYMGSGKLLKRAQEKYGIDNFEKVVLETVDSPELLNEREQYWIAETNAAVDPQAYNLAQGGDGGDLTACFTDEERAEIHRKQAIARSKGWYVSRVDDPTETYVQNISKWCEKHSVDKSMPSVLNDPNHHLFQKQTKGWRIRRSDMPELLPYEDRRHIPTDNKCKGKTWKLVDGKRIWI